MSWFREDVDPVEVARCDEEIADGVFVERRSLFGLSAVAAAVALFGGAATAGVRSRRRGPLTLEDFLEATLPQARKLVASGGEDEEPYLYAIAALMARLDEPGADMRSTMRTFKKRHAVEGEHFPLAATLMRLKPGKGFRHHDHRDYNGVILGVEGEVRIRNYDILGDQPVPPKGTTFAIRETRDDLILPGRFSSLGTRRENVHDLVAGPDGAVVLDVFTRFQPRARSYWLDVEPQPRDAEKRIYEAAWR